MTVIEDDSILHPVVTENDLLYVSCLNEGHDNYTRFFDALLIKRPSHPSFFRDLKGFREQPKAISLLQQTNENKALYKEVTRLYLSSRFAHPWCRKTPMKTGFWRAEWGMIEGKKQNAEIVREEEKLHKLLVPIWIHMKGRMFPGDDIVRVWCEQERARRITQQESKSSTTVSKLHDLDFDADEQEEQERSWKQHGSDSDDQDEAVDIAQAEQAAAAVFRLAAAGMIISQTPKRKLRWLTKKPK